MATRTPEVITTAGVVPTFHAASAGGDKVPPGDSTAIYVKNRSGGAFTVTLVTPQTFEGDLATADRTASVAAGEAGDRFIAIPDTYQDPADGLVSITWSATATVTFAAVRR